MIKGYNVGANVGGIRLRLRWLTQAGLVMNSTQGQLGKGVTLPNVPLLVPRMCVSTHTVVK